MTKKIEVIENVKKNYVRLALETGKQTTVAHKAGISRNTLRKWIDEYGDEIRQVMETEIDSPIIYSDVPVQEELQRKYDQAMRLLGEKELEVAMLKSLLKKSSLP
ncbi:transposase [Sutcliffiella cohnii]|uniref:transposase n=1 Tax=Sutcliffiella cohnii TaxID=33932 RepID=UPI002E1AD016|nr:transposase [Sutcliffiella cohnii]MED4019149.1 transposase [Sutcliffiella cohnii]